MTTYSPAAMSNPTIRVIAILSLLTSISPRKMGLLEICARLGIAKSTGCLVLAELCANGYLIQEHGTALYGLGMKFGLQPNTLTKPPVPSIAFSARLHELHLELRLPLSIACLSRRSTVVTHTIQPVSVQARLGFRRPHAAPFGASFLLDADTEERSRWMELALQFEECNKESLRASIDARLKRTLVCGYEVVYQWEQDIFDRYEVRDPRWMGDLFELDARMNACRREILQAYAHNYAHHSGGCRDCRVSRIAIPLSERVSESPSCIEVWLEGREISEEEIHEYVARVVRFLGQT